MITQEEMNKYFETAHAEQIAADEARDEVREMIEQLDTNQIRYICSFIKERFNIKDFEPYGGELCASYRNGIKEEIAHCDDVGLLDLLWRILAKTRESYEDIKVGQKQA